MTYEEYQALLPTLPQQPGVYKFVDKDEEVLYVGKAKSLRNRVASYFTSGKNQAHKTRIMVRSANRLELVLVESEADALLLEATLIKQLQPRFNVMLKDDKSYNYICIKQERFPRVFITRRVIRDGSTYFGPYISKHRVKDLLDLIKELFPLRTCTLNLSASSIEQGKHKLCLEYHIKNCEGPCEGLESEQAYMAKIEQIKNILRGNFASVRRHFQEQMLQLAEELKFEQAQVLKEKLRAFEDYQGKSTVVSTTIRDVDVFSIAVEEKRAFVNYIKVVHGAIINTYTQELEKRVDEEEADVLSLVILELRERFNSIAPEVIVPMDVVLSDPEIRLTIPQIGDKRKLLDLSEKNLQFHQLQKRRTEASHTRKQTPAERILRTLQADLQMDVLPMHLECFDNSNLQGSNPTSSCVVFKNAKPSKKDYRHYHVKTVEGPNDFASMEEVVFRRYRRLLDEGTPLPQLIVIDGGKGQLSAAVKSLQKLEILDKVTIIGIAKRLEEIFFPGDSVPLYINKKSESLKLIQQARNEAHRFAITFHRQLRSKAMTQTELKGIPGVGEKTVQKLIQHFGSVAQVRAAEEEALREVVGAALAAKLRGYFKE